MEFSEEQWAGLKKHCEDLDIIFLSSPFSVNAVKMLERINISAWKIGSGEINNSQLFEAISKTNKPVLLSTGMSNWFEIDQSVNRLNELKISYCIFQTTSKYPTSLRDVGLNIIQEMKTRYDIPVGLSDHTGSISSSMAAISSGASMIEVHVVFDKNMFGPDSKSSLTFKQLEALIKFRDDFYEINSNPVDKDLIAKDLIPMKKLFNKSLIINSFLSKGSLLTHKNLTAKKPGIGIPVQDIDYCIGRKIIKDLEEGHILEWSDMEGRL